jgi:endonuclease/exonuclease/phosphatase family metal-dependent hydrolase
MKKTFILILMLTLFIFTINCSETDTSFDPSSTGSLLITPEWQTANAGKNFHQTLSVPEDVEKLVITLSAPDMEIIEKEFIEITENFRIDDIPEGDGKTVILEAYAEDDELIYEGTKTGISIIAQGENSITVEMLPIIVNEEVTFRVMTYNVLNLMYDNYDERIEHFETIMAHSNPDVLIAQEIHDYTAAQAILDALNAEGDHYASCQFINGSGSDNMFYYRKSVVTLVNQYEIETDLREISEYTATISGNTVRFYSCHLKASQGEENEQRRYNEVCDLRDRLDSLPPDTEFIIAGDMNLYSDDEPAYQKFIESGIGKADDLGVAGDWHNNTNYRNYHTQCTREEQTGGDGAAGGMDDRFDFIFTSEGINNNAGIEYIPGSHEVLGNDGNHFNLSINDGYNNAVPSDVADALYYASDHLPVYAEFMSVAETTFSYQADQTEITLINNQLFEEQNQMKIVYKEKVNDSQSYVWK